MVVFEKVSIMRNMLGDKNMHLAITLSYFKTVLLAFKS